MLCPGFTYHECPGYSVSCLLTGKTLRIGCLLPQHSHNLHYRPPEYPRPPASTCEDLSGGATRLLFYPQNHTGPGRNTHILNAGLSEFVRPPKVNKYNIGIKRCIRLIPGMKKLQDKFIPEADTLPGKLW